MQRDRPHAVLVFLACGQALGDMVRYRRWCGGVCSITFYDGCGTPS